jgi:hypothetical protein
MPLRLTSRRSGNPFQRQRNREGGRPLSYGSENSLCLLHVGTSTGTVACRAVTRVRRLHCVHGYLISLLGKCTLAAGLLNVLLCLAHVLSAPRALELPTVDFGLTKYLCLSFSLHPQPASEAFDLLERL